MYLLSKKYISIIIKQGINFKWEGETYFMKYILCNDIFEELNKWQQGKTNIRIFTNTGQVPVNRQQKINLEPWNMLTKAIT
jgi:hypothetical protein